MIHKIGFGGGCHWCTEAVFQSLKGVVEVEQGYISSTASNSELSEAVVVYFDPENIPLKVLMEIHLLTHNSTSNHSRRDVYRSAIYYFEKSQEKILDVLMKELQLGFNKSIITRILPFSRFKSSREEILNYYTKNPELPFCKTYISPKLSLLKKQFSKYSK